MVSIRDVAKLANVSIATVSRAISDPTVVSEATRTRVLAAIEATGYVANPIARGLRTQKMQAVLVLVPDIANPFFARIIQGIEATAHSLGYRILLGDTQGNRARGKDYVKLAKQRLVDGIILLSATSPFDVGGSQEDWPPVVVGCEFYSALSMPSVRIDNVAAAREACDYLIALGHRHIGFINGPRQSPLSNDRLEGYRAALSDADIPYRAELVTHGDFSLESGVSCMSRLIGMRHGPSAVFCASDEMAIGAMRAVRKFGFKVPEDISVMGFDDIPSARFCEPPLTTVRQPQAEIGHELMQLAYRLIQDGQPEQMVSVILPHALVVRDSTASPASFLTNL